MEEVLENCSKHQFSCSNSKTHNIKNDRKESLKKKCLHHYTVILWGWRSLLRPALFSFYPSLDLKFQKMKQEVKASWWPQVCVFGLSLSLFHSVRFITPQRNVTVLQPSVRVSRTFQIYHLIKQQAVGQWSPPEGVKVQLSVIKATWEKHKFSTCRKSRTMMPSVSSGSMGRMTRRCSRIVKVMLSQGKYAGGLLV